MKRVLIVLLLLIPLAALRPWRASPISPTKPIAASKMKPSSPSPAAPEPPKSAASWPQAGVFRYPWEIWIERAAPALRENPGRRISLRPTATPAEVYARLARGDIFYFEFTVPEGSNIFDIAQSLEPAASSPRPIS